MSARTGREFIRSSDGRHLAGSRPGRPSADAAAARSAAIEHTPDVDLALLRGRLLDRYGGVPVADHVSAVFEVLCVDEDLDDLRDTDIFEREWTFDDFAYPGIAYGHCGRVSAAFNAAAEADLEIVDVRGWTFEADDFGLQHHASVITVNGADGPVDLAVDWTWAQWRGADWSALDPDVVDPFPLVLPVAEYGARFRREIVDQMCGEIDGFEVRCTDPATLGLDCGAAYTGRPI